MTSHTNASRRCWKLRFTLRTLLFLVTVIAVTLWAWPRWRNYREEVNFEKAVEAIGVGNTTEDVWYFLREHPYKLTTFAKKHGKHVVLMSHEWPNAIYFTYMVVLSEPGGASDQAPCLSVEVFRVPRTSLKQLPRSEREASGIQKHMNDFLEFIAGDREEISGFDYELIHADLPESPTAM